MMKSKKQNQKENTLKNQRNDLLIYLWNIGFYAYNIPGPFIFGIPSEDIK